MAEPTWTATRIKALRHGLGLTQDALARKVGVQFATVNRWENGHSRPTQLAVAKLDELQATQGEGRS